MSLYLPSPFPDLEKAFPDSLASNPDNTGFKNCPPGIKLATVFKIPNFFNY